MIYIIQALRFLLLVTLSMANDKYLQFWCLLSWVIRVGLFVVVLFSEIFDEHYAHHLHREPISTTITHVYYWSYLLVVKANKAKIFCQSYHLQIAIGIWDISKKYLEEPCKVTPSLGFRFFKNYHQFLV